MWQFPANLAEAMSYGCHIYRAHSSNVAACVIHRRILTGMMAGSGGGRAKAKKNKAFQPCFSGFA
ncbi:hypothetical protein F3P66_07870 [Agrobacterium fabrum]|uniref:Uncharacterized protein n=1 Tax=Agrobacterium fabrum (strain C58 / ATCC 33970) TaxID=176299 RepID=Q8UFW0_AGRFC|nr:hypothetical protein Atu1287 [Agrobacterium fabrum str. C58]QRM59374.1 hypothetical protein F3P66_07870 [Agrobacterium fabrum]TRB30793.1 hypothetical protein EXN51_01010 [Agrobacterium fabrum]